MINCEDGKHLKEMRCGRCSYPLPANNEAINCYDKYYECPSMNTSRHRDRYKLCKQCTFANIKVYENASSDVFSDTYDPPPSNDMSRSYRTIQAQRRVCLAFTEEYIRVYLHCFENPAICSHSDALRKQIKNRNQSINDLYEPQIAILMDDFEKFWERGKSWVNMIGKWSGGGANSVFTALCHCNQINNKISSDDQDKIEYYLSAKHAGQLEGPWPKLSTKLYKCSITENEDTITAVLDIVGTFLSKLTDKEKLKLTYRGRFNHA